MDKDYYKILGVSENASPEEIKRAYRRLAHKYHPDRPGGDEQKFKEINQAYQVLSDKTKRQQYDAMRAWGGAFSKGHTGNFDFFTQGGSAFRERFTPFGFGMGGFDSLDDILREFFGGMDNFSTGTQARTSYRAPHQSVNFSYHGPNNTRISIEIENVSQITPKMKKIIDEFVKELFRELK